MANLSNAIDIIRHNNAAAAATTDVTPSTAVDMAGYEGCIFIFLFGTITSGAVTSCKVQQSSDSGGSPDGFSDLEGSAVTVADDDDNQVVVIDVYRPTKRYLLGIIDRGTQNAVVDGILAIPYGARTQPVPHSSATVVSVEVHASPDEGTA